MRERERERYNERKRVQNEKESGFIFLPQREFFSILAAASNISSLTSNLRRRNRKRQRRRRRRQRWRRRGKDKVDVGRGEVRGPLHRHRLPTLTTMSDDTDVINVADDVLTPLSTSSPGLSLLASLHLSTINSKDE